MTREHEEFMAAKRAIAVAKPTEFRRQCERLAHLAAEGVVDRVKAADVLYDAAIANGLVDIHGEDWVAGIFAAAFEWAPVVSVSKGRAA
jgi:hypothetical protein